MKVTIVDYQSGNISSVINSFKEVTKGKVNLEITSDIKKIKSSKLWKKVNKYQSIKVYELKS